MISDILILISTVFILIGIIGILRFKKMIPRLMTTAMIDTIAVLTMFTGLIFRDSFSYHTLKLIILMIITLLISPILSHVIIKSALIRRR